MAKYCFMIGATYSSLGKGLGCASILYLLKQRGLEVQYLKLDPFLNSDSGGLAPREHGETWVADDGHECDVDLANISNITGLDLSKDNVYTAGRLYKELIESNDNGKYIGQTLQLLPHFSSLIYEKIKKLGDKSDVVFIEVGGTCGSDAESVPFYESIREFKLQHSKDVLVILMAPVFLINNGEWKTKPLQRGVRDLQAYSLHPDILLCRSPQPTPIEIDKKISKLTNVPVECIFNATDVSNIYEIPLDFHKQNIDDVIADLLRLPRKSCKINKYKEIVDCMNDQNLPQVHIGLVGKYAHESAYTSIREAIAHASVANKVKTIIHWIKAEDLEDTNDIKSFFSKLHGIIICPGFDKRGIEGKIRSAQYAREKKVPFLGICLGLQCAVIEFARNVCKLEDANSLEFNKKTEHPVIHYVEGQEGLVKKSGTMRLGAYDCELDKNSLAYALYKKTLISERHRHRYEVNNKYVEMLSDKGFVVSGKNPQSGLVEIMELKNHPYYIGTQAHPEFRSKILDAAPLFDGLIKATIEFAK